MFCVFPPRFTIHEQKGRALALDQSALLELLEALS